MGQLDRNILKPKHDGKALEALPMLFTYSPLREQQQSHGVVGFSQAGGHEGVFKANGPVLEKKVSKRERDFYVAAASGQWPEAFLPGFHGDAGGSSDRISLQNLLHGMKCPCVMDLKMGTRSVESTEQSILKKVKMSALDLFTGTTFSGVRLEGMSVYRALEKGKIKTSKAQSHAISATVTLNLQDVMMFFLTDESGVRRDIAKRFLGNLRHILHHFQTANNRYLFIGSSILLIYDNDNTAPHSRWARALERGTRLHPDTYAALRRKTRVDVRMIDFAHTGPLPAGQDRDTGYIAGLKSIISALANVIGSGSSPQKPIFSLAAAAADAAAAEVSAQANRGTLGHALTFNAAHDAAEALPLAACSPQPLGTAPAGNAGAAGQTGQAAPAAGSAYPAIPPVGYPPAAAHASPETVAQPGAPEPTFWSLLGVPRMPDAVWGGAATPEGGPKYPDLPPLHEGNERWQWSGPGESASAAKVPTEVSPDYHASGGAGAVKPQRPTV